MNQETVAETQVVAREQNESIQVAHDRPTLNRWATMMVYETTLTKKLQVRRRCRSRTYDIRRLTESSSNRIDRLMKKRCWELEYDFTDEQLFFFHFPR